MLFGFFKRMIILQFRGYRFHISVRSSMLIVLLSSVSHTEICLFGLSIIAYFQLLFIIQRVDVFQSCHCYRKMYHIQVWCIAFFQYKISSTFVQFNTLHLNSFNTASLNICLFISCLPFIYFLIFIFGCSGSSWLQKAFLQLFKVSGGYSLIANAWAANTTILRHRKKN